MANFGQPRPAPTTQPTPRFDHGTPDGYQFFLDLGPLPNADKRYFKGDVAFWNEVMKHGTYDEFWKARNLRPHLKNIRPAVMTVGGWFDAENLFGALETYHTIEASSPETTNILVMGPWVHGGWNRTDGDSLGPITFGAETSDYYRDEVEFPFFEHHLKGKGDLRAHRGPRLRHWHQPVANPRPVAPRQRRAETSIYLARQRLTLSSNPPPSPAPRPSTTTRATPPALSPSSMRSTSAWPANTWSKINASPPAGPTSSSTRRPRWKQDLTLAGPIEAALHVATTGTDADWVVKVIDVYPPSFPDPAPNPAGHPHGQLPATRPGRRHARQVPQGLR